MVALNSNQVLRDEAKEILDHRDDPRCAASALTERDKDVSLHLKLNQCKFVAFVKTESRELGAGTHSFASGTMDIVGPPGVVPLAVVQTPAYHFTIEGTERNATDSCEEYLALLQRMVGTFKADHP